MSDLHYQAYVEAIRNCDAVDRGELFDTLAARRNSAGAHIAEVVTREEVLRELLDEAHAKIRTLEQALERLTGALISGR
jgi:hypothetical protein